MKIEVGESLIYSWLRHEKNCQIVQTNWSSSTFWCLENRALLQDLFDFFTAHYKEKYRFDIFGNSKSLEQVIKQAEIDVLGIAFLENTESIYAVDIAYHRSGLNYSGGKNKNIEKITKKCLRTVLCLLGYFSNITTGEIIFASPKILNPTLKMLIPIFEEMSDLINQNGLPLSISLVCNDEFYTDIMEPILSKTKYIGDTAELFVRSIQMRELFPLTVKVGPQNTGKQNKRTSGKKSNQINQTVVNNGKANNKIQKWASNSTQNNHKIIRAFYQIQGNGGTVSLKDLKERCLDNKNHLDVYVRDFNGNFNSMKTDKGNSHGKVFLVNDGNVTIWEEVSDTLKKYRDSFIK